MSLIHEALRKARREAAQRDDPGVIYPGGLTGQRPRRGLAVGIIVGVALTIGLAITVGGTLWWVVKGRSSDQSAEAGPDLSTTKAVLQEDRVDAHASEMSTGEPGSRAAAEQPAGSTTAPSGGPSAPSADDPGVTEQRPSDSGNRTVTFATPTHSPRPASADREYVAEADLGYTSLSLDYIVFRPVDPFAQINGFDVRVGSTIEGFKVEEITADAVRLRDARGPLVLRAE